MFDKFVTRLLMIVAVLTIWFFILINAESEKNNTVENSFQNLSIECTINGVRRYGKDCFEGLQKFSRTVGYIVTGVIVTIILCCCGCVCCACKIIHSNKNRTRGGFVIERRVVEIPAIAQNSPAVAAVAQ